MFAATGYSASKGTQVPFIGAKNEISFGTVLGNCIHRRDG